MFVVEIVEGFQVPVMPFVELEGNAGAVPFKQIGLIGAKVGVTLELTITSIVVVLEQLLLSGLKV